MARAHVVSLALRLAPVLAVILTASCGTPAPARRDAASELARQTSLLEKRVQLAEDDRFYLVLDPDARELVLMLKGASLHHFAVRGLEIGRPQVAFYSRRTTPEWAGVIWPAATLVPERTVPRVEIEVREDNDTEPPSLPPTPEEVIRVPEQFSMTFGGSLIVEVVADDEGASGGVVVRVARGVRGWLHDAWQALSWSRPPLRLRLHLSRGDADSLYRSLPPDTSMLILPPALGAPALMTPGRDRRSSHLLQDDTVAGESAVCRGARRTARWLHG